MEKNVLMLFLDVSVCLKKKEAPRKEFTGGWPPSVNGTPLYKAFATVRATVVLPVPAIPQSHSIGDS